MLRLLLKIAPLGAWLDAPRERATRSPEQTSSSGRLWWQFHITKRGLREIVFTLRPGGTPESDYRERLAMIASPIVAFADDFVDR